MRRVLLVVAVVVGVIAPLAGQSLSDAEIAASIRAGADKRQLNNLIAECTAAPGFGEIMGTSLATGLSGGGGTTYAGSYRVTFVSHYGQIALAASERQRRYQPAPTAENISDELRASRLHLWIEPLGDTNRSNRTVDLSAAIDHVIVRAEDRPAQSAQPVTFTTEPVAFTNLFGAQFTTNRALATFETEAALALAKERDLEVVVITKAGERRCNVSRDRVRRMFQASK